MLLNVSIPAATWSATNCGTMARAPVEGISDALQGAVRLRRSARYEWQVHGGDQRPGPAGAEALQEVQPFHADGGGDGEATVPWAVAVEGRLHPQPAGLARHPQTRNWVVA